MLSNDTGTDNTSTGAHSLFNNQGGNSNTATGVSALYNNKTGANNTATGVKALFSNTSDGNTANGQEALKFNTIGNLNAGVGLSALVNNVGGSYNTAIGAALLNVNTSGSFITAVGFQANVLTNNLSNATAIGAGAKVGCSDCVVLGDIDAKVGIGLQNPTAKLHVNPNGAGGIYIGEHETTGGKTGLALGISNLSGGHGYIQATQGSGSLPTGDLLLNPNGGQVGIGYTNQTTVQFPLDINQHGDNGIRLSRDGGSFNAWVISNKARLAFTHISVEKAYISPSDGAYFEVSDARLKKDVTRISSVLDRVKALQAKSYKYISNEGTENAGKISTGFIAQEVMPLFPNLVSGFTRCGKDSTDKTVSHGINYAGFSVVAIKAIQEQQEQMETLKTNNKEVLSQMDLIKTENKLMLKQMVKMQAAIDAISNK